MKLGGILLISLFLAAICTQALAQEIAQNHEIGIRTYDLRNLSVVYKKQKEENSYIRIRLATGEIDINKFKPFNGSFTLGIAGGTENRQTISEKLIFVTGFELMCSLRTGLVGSKASFYITPGIGAILGFTYLVSDKLLVGIETIPTASFKFGLANKSASFTDLNIRFASSQAALFVAYRFSK